MRRHRVLPFGAEIGPDGTRFRLWAPNADAVLLSLEDGADLPMTPKAEGWFELTTPKAAAGSRYRYRIGDAAYPDPAARYQPDGVLGPSEVVDPGAYKWSDGSWNGIPWERAVIYEMHVGAFSSDGDFDGAIRHLDHLSALGVTLVEVMPVADCPGRWNWGYDGVLLFAPAGRSGGPEALKRFVNACHNRGIGVLLDVVYNHFGPAGNFLHDYADRFFTEKHQTPWGAAINFDDVGSPIVRRFFIENALYWLEEYHFDGLRFDAVHAIQDSGPVPILHELGACIRAEFPSRHIHLILENDHNEPSLLGHGLGGPGPYDAQWNDDFHHALRVVLTGAEDGVYEDYQDDPHGRLGRALAEGFVYQGEPSNFRKGRKRGGPTTGLPPTAFVNFIQNHDQVGNHAYGWRLPKFADQERFRAAAAMLLLTPGIPLLFMGEEWASSTPFPFFCDFEGELADAVRRGRIAEFSGFAEFRDEAARAKIPDPVAESTFRSAKLNWAAIAEPNHADMLSLYQELLAVRRNHIMPLLASGDTADGRFERFGVGGLLVAWDFGAQRLQLLANLGDQPADGRRLEGEVLYRSHVASDHLPPWFVAVFLGGVSSPAPARG